MLEKLNNDLGEPGPPSIQYVHIQIVPLARIPDGVVYPNHWSCFPTWSKVCTPINSTLMPRPRRSSSRCRSICPFRACWRLTFLCRSMCSSWKLPFRRPRPTCRPKCQPCTPALASGSGSFANHVDTEISGGQAQANQRHLSTQLLEAQNKLLGCDDVRGCFSDLLPDMLKPAFPAKSDLPPTFLFGTFF